MKEDNGSEFVHCVRTAFMEGSRRLQKDGGYGMACLSRIERHFVL